MLKHLFSRRELADHTPLSQFVLMSSSAEKKKVYNKAIQEASEEQRAMMEQATTRLRASRQRETESKGLIA